MKKLCYSVHQQMEKLILSIVYNFILAVHSFSPFFMYLIIFKFPFSVFLILYDVISNEFAITSPAYILFSCIICFTPKQNFMKLIIFTYILVLKFFYLFILMNVIDSKSSFYFRFFFTIERFLVICIIVGFPLL